MVLKGCDIDERAVLTALYLQGIPRRVCPPRRRWAGVLETLQNAEARSTETFDSPLDISCHLRSCGYFAEAAALEVEGIFDLARRLVASDRVLTVLDSDYPQRWRERLGEASPPVLWQYRPNQSLPSLSTLPDRPLFAMVGSRSISASVARFCEEVAARAVGLGFAVISGDAEGCDRVSGRAAHLAGGVAVAILPYGLSHLKLKHHDAPADLYLSLCPPREPFSTARAMERNQLIYAAADYSFIGHARYREGGTWVGANQAIRRRTTRFLVREDATNPAHRAFVDLGAVSLRDPAQLAAALASSIDPPLAQPGLFAELDDRVLAEAS